MTRQMIAGLFAVFAIVGCGGAEKTSNAESKAMSGGNEQGAGQGDVCGGFRGATCKGNLYCNYPIEAKCGEGDQTGICAVPPDACTAEEDPVCGCNKKTYSNKCQAASARESVRSMGKCE